MRTLIAILLTICLLPVGSINAQSPTPFVCPVTLPNGEKPPAKVNPFGTSETTIYQDGIWVTISSDGVLGLTPDQELVFGPLTGWRSHTVSWMRDEGVTGWIIVSGQRLDERSPLQPQTPLSPQRQYVQVGHVKTGIAFPSAGCWKVTGTVASPFAGDATITWVVDVRFVEAITVTPSP